LTATSYNINSLPERLIGRWNELLETSPVRSAFLSHAFCAAVQKVRGGVFVIHLQNENGEEGFLPLQMKRGRGFLGHAEKVGGSMSDYFGIIGHLSSPLDTEALLQAARLSSLRFDHAVAELCPFPFLDAEVSHGVRLEIDTSASVTDALALTNKRFVAEVSRNERRVRTQMGSLEFEWHSADHRILNNLISTKRAQYRRTAVDDGLRSPWARRLLTELYLNSYSSYCRGVLSTLEAGGLWMASNFGLLCSDGYHHWFSVYNQRFRQYGPGHLLLVFMIEHCRQNGIATFDFGEGESFYKSRYGGSSYDLWKGAVRKSNLLGESERVLQSVEWRLRSCRHWLRLGRRILPKSIPVN